MRTYPNIVQSLDKLNILVFWEILKERNPYLLDVKYADNPDEYDEETKSYIISTWERLFDDYHQMVDDSKNRQVLDNNLEVSRLSFQMQSLVSAANGLTELEKHKDILPTTDYEIHKQRFIEVAKKLAPGIKINAFSPASVNIVAIDKYVDALSNQFNELAKENREKVDEQIDNVFTAIVRVEALVGRSIDVSQTSVSRWIAYEKQARQKEAAIKQANNRKT